MHKETLDYFRGDSLAASAWLGKYALSTETTPDDMHKRMAKEFARIQTKNYKYPYFRKKHLSELGKKSLERKTYESNYNYYYNWFKGFKYIIPQGSIMAMLGNTEKIGSLSNCFVIGQPEDSYGGIFQKDQECAQLMKRRGGVGLDISTLRPHSTVVSNSAGTSTGAVSFMERYSNTTREVAQEGRRGALMITIDCRHPDVLEFVNIKKDRTKVTGANISVMLRDDFMEAVKNDEDYILRFPCNYNLDKVDSRVFDKYEYNKLYSNDYDPENISYFKKIKAKELYDAIVENAWDNAEPGQMFIDRHWNYSPDSVYPEFKGITTNPCGEIFMGSYDACRLLALNLYSFVKNPFTENAKFDFKLFQEAVYAQQELADNLIDLELEHIDRILDKLIFDPEEYEVRLPEIELWTKIRKITKSSRRTGCGFTALGDTLAALGIKYDSSEAYELTRQILHCKMKEELNCTIDLSILRGSFIGWDSKKEFYFKRKNIKLLLYLEGHNYFYEMLTHEFPLQVKRMIKFGRRNVSWSTVAPTGTVNNLPRSIVIY